MIKQQAFRVVHPAGTFMVIVAWNSENTSDIWGFLRLRVGSLATLTELTDAEVSDFPASEGHPILMMTAN